MNKPGKLAGRLGGARRGLAPPGAARERPSYTVPRPGPSGSPEARGILTTRAAWRGAARTALASHSAPFQHHIGFESVLREGGRCLLPWKLKQLDALAPATVARTLVRKCGRTFSLESLIE